MKTVFISREYPLMNSFLSRLQFALENLPDNPKPQCEGFYLCFFDPKGQKMTNERIGYVPPEKEEKYCHLAFKKAYDTFYFKTTRSKDFADDDLERYAGGFRFRTSLEKSLYTGTSAHESMVDEAISALWPLGMTILDEYEDKDFVDVYASSDLFFQKIAIEASQLQEDLLPDNKWVKIISELMHRQKF